MPLPYVPSRQFRHASHGMWRRGCALLLACGMGGLAVVASATAQEPLREQPEQATVASADPGGIGRFRVMVLRETTDGAATLAEQVDAALLQDLAALADIDRPAVSPVDYADIQLTVGCADTTRECLSAIAEVLQVHALLLRSLVRTEDGYRLALIYYDAAARDEPVRVSTGDDAAIPEQDVVARVPSQVRALFGLTDPDVSEPSSEDPVDQVSAESASPPHYDLALGTAAGDGGLSKIRPWTWVGLGVGSAVLGGGIVFALLADRSHSAFLESPVGTGDQYEAALEVYDRADRQAKWAKVLIPTGGAILAAGGALLILDLLSEPRGRHERLALTPTAAGGMLMWQGALGGLLR